MHFDRYVHQWNHHHNKNADNFHCPLKSLYPPFQPFPSPTSRPRQQWICFLLQCVNFHFVEFYISGIIWYAHFCAYLFSTGIMILRLYRWILSYLSIYLLIYMWVVYSLGILWNKQYLPTDFTRPALHWYQKQANKRKEYYRVKFLMKVDVQILNKILANGIQYYIKITMHHEQVRLISGT